MTTQQQTTAPNVRTENRLAEILNPPRLPAQMQDRPPPNRLPPQPLRLGGSIQVKDVLKLLDFKRSDDGKEMCRTYGTSLAVLAAERDKANASFALIAKLNGFPTWVVMGHTPRPPVNLVEAWAKGASGMADILEADLLARAQALVTDWGGAAVWMVQNGQAGQEKWSCPTACSYEYFTYHVTDEKQTAQRESSFRAGRATTHRTETDFEKTHKHVGHTHGLVDARRGSVEDRSVERPDRVQQVIESWPSWVRQRAYLIIGTQVQERIVEQDVKVETRTEVNERVVYDPWEPGLAVAGVVFTGWTGAEMESERQEKEQQRQQEAEWARREAERQAREARWDAEAAASRETQRLREARLPWVVGAAVLWIVLSLVIAGVAAAYFDDWNYEQSASYRATASQHAAEMRAYQSASGWAKFWGTAPPVNTPDPWYGRAWADIGTYLLVLVVSGGPAVLVLISQTKPSH